MNKACYRLPYADYYVEIQSEQEPLILPSTRHIGESKGFVIAPFTTSEETPIILIQPDKVETHYISKFNIENIAKPTAKSQKPKSSTETSYQNCFKIFHDAILNQRFSKLVLARRKDLLISSKDIETLFLEACRLYPRLMIMMWNTPQTGTWLVASPEILLEEHNEQYHTVALAGTMPYKPEYLTWSKKNIQEQHIVEQYISDTISPLSYQLVKDGPVTMRAGNLAHLRTDFRFHANEGVTLGDIISSLHPTPAVCGLPKAEAMLFIRDNEKLHRRYYSGFAGPVGINNETHLYVSLRCAEIHSLNSSSKDFMACTLYSGGGIMPDSKCTLEWQETENKMKTIADVLQ